MCNYEESADSLTEAKDILLAGSQQKENFSSNLNSVLLGKIVSEIWGEKVKLVRGFLWVCINFRVVNTTWRGYQADFNGRCVVVDLYAVLAQSFTVSSGKQTAAWRRSQGCNCVARKLKWKFNLCSWILLWNFGRGDILTWNFWLRSAGCPDWKCSALLSL